MDERPIWPKEKLFVESPVINDYETIEDESKKNIKRQN